MQRGTAAFFYPKFLFSGVPARPGTEFGYCLIHPHRDSGTIPVKGCQAPFPFAPGVPAAMHRAVHRAVAALAYPGDLPLWRVGGHGTITP